MLTNEGTIIHRDAGSFNLYSGVFLHNAAASLYDLQDDASVIGHPDIYGVPVFVNAGIFRKSAGAGESRLTNLRFHNVGGSVEVLSGRLQLSGGGTSTNGTLSAAAGAVLDLSNFGKPHTWQGRLAESGGGQILLASGALTSSGALALRFPSNLFHWNGGKITGPLVNELSLTLDGTNQARLNGTLFNSGHVLHNGQSNLTFVGSAVIENAPGAVYTLAGDGSMDWLKPGPFAGNGTFRNQGLFQKTGGTGESRFTRVGFQNQGGNVEAWSGTLRFDNGYAQTSGSTRLAGGILASSTPLDIQGGNLVGSGTIEASLLNAGLLSPGNSIGQINILIDYTQRASGELLVGIAGRNPGQFDQVNVSGSAALGGTLTVTLTNGFTPAPGDTFPILSCSSRSGSFVVTNGVALGNGTSLALEYRANGVFLVVTGQVAGLTVASPTVSGTNFGFSLTTVVGKIYTVQTTEALGSMDWTNIMTFSGDGTVREISIPLLRITQRFFRVFVSD